MSSHRDQTDNHVFDISEDIRHHFPDKPKVDMRKRAKVLPVKEWAKEYYEVFSHYWFEIMVQRDTPSIVLADPVPPRFRSISCCDEILNVMNTLGGGVLIFRIFNGCYEREFFKVYRGKPIRNQDGTILQQDGLSELAQDDLKRRNLK